jgi:hypothetical protein
MTAVLQAMEQTSALRVVVPVREKQLRRTSVERRHYATTAIGPGARLGRSTRAWRARRWGHGLPRFVAHLFGGTWGDLDVAANHPFLLVLQARDDALNKDNHDRPCIQRCHVAY